MLIRIRTVFHRYHTKWRINSRQNQNLWLNKKYNQVKNKNCIQKVQKTKKARRRNKDKIRISKKESSNQTSLSMISLTHNIETEMRVSNLNYRKAWGAIRNKRLCFISSSLIIASSLVFLDKTKNNSKLSATQVTNPFNQNLISTLSKHS